MADYIDYLRGYASPRDDAAYTGLNADFGRRLAAMLQNAPEHVRRPDLIESLARDDAGQRRAIQSVAQRLGIPFTPNLLARGIPGYAAPVGGSQHQGGYAADFNLSNLQPEGRDWLRSNAGAYGLRFPLPSTDAGHIEFDHDWRGELPNAPPASVSKLPTSPPPIMDSALYGLGASRPVPETSMPPIWNQAIRGFRDGGAVEAALRIAAKQTDKNPSDAQKEAGNYAKGKIRIHSMEIAIENPKGSTRSGTDKDGKTWKCTLPAHYGDLKRTEGADGDPVDCYIGDNHDTDKVYVVDQIDAKTGKFDEHKVMLSFPSKQSALTAYEKAFSDGKGRDRIGSVSEMSVADFRHWLKDGNTKKPVGDLKQNFANGGTVMPLLKGEKNVGRNISTLQGEGKKRSQSIAIALDVARRSNRASGGRVGYAEGGDVDPLVPGGLPPLPEPREEPPITDRIRNSIMNGLYPNGVADHLAAYRTPSEARPPVADELADMAWQLPQGVNRGIDQVINTPWDLLVRAPAAAMGYDIPQGRYASRFNSGVEAETPVGEAAGAVGELAPNLAAAAPVWRAAAEAARVSGAKTAYDALPRGSIPATAAALVAFPSAATPAEPQDGLTPELRSRRDALQRKQNGDKDARGRVIAPPTPLLRAEREELGAINQMTADFLKMRGAAQFDAERRDQETAGAERARQVREAVEARDRIRNTAPRPFNEEYPTINAMMPFAPAAAGLLTGAAMGPARVFGEYKALSRWRDALSRANTTTSPRVREQMATEASAINQTWPKSGLRDKINTYAPAAVISGAEGAALVNLPYGYNQIQLPAENPERTALQEYYRRLPEDHPDRARTLELLNNEAVLPKDNPGLRAAPPPTFNRSLMGAAEAAGASMLPTTLVNAMRPYERVLPRAQTLALERDVANRQRPLPPLSPEPPPGPPSLPTTPPAAPAALSPAPPLSGPQSRTSTSASDAPHHSHLQPREAGRFAGPPKKPRKPRPDPADEAAELHTRDDRLTRGQQNGGAVNGALELAHKYANGGKAKGGFFSRLFGRKGKGGEGDRDEYADGGRAVSPVAFVPDTQGFPLGDITAMPIPPMPRRLDLSSGMEGMRGVQPSRMELPMAPMGRQNDASDPLAGFAEGGIVDSAREALRERAINGPSVSDMLNQLMMHPSLGIGSRAGAARGNDYVRANEIQRRMMSREMLEAPTYDLGVTGGSPMRFPDPIPDLPHPRAATGLASNPGMVHAANPYGMKFSGRYPANVNETPAPGSVEAWRMARDRDFTVPPGIPERAQGGEVSQGSHAGPVQGPTGGRDDALPINVKSGSFVIPSDCVSGLPGAGNNTAAGMKMLETLFGRATTQTHADGGSVQDVPIMISHGEYVVSPEQVAKLGNGDTAQGHRVLDAFVKQVRAENVKALRKLPAPARD